MIKVNIKTDELKETRNKMNLLGVHVTVNVDGPSVILEEELYRLLKEFEKQMPEVWINALERVMLDMCSNCKEGDEE